MTENSKNFVRGINGELYEVKNDGRLGKAGIQETTTDNGRTLPAAPVLPTESKPEERPMTILERVLGFRREEPEPPIFGQDS